jgi:hypothetical protein
MRIVVAVLFSSLALATVLASSAGCSSDAVGVDACRRIEEARCRAALACGVSLDIPLRQGRDAESAVDACIRYYRDTCRHGLTVAQEPGGAQVDQCVAAIQGGDCVAIKTPELSPACGFLAVDAGTPAPADAATEAASDAAAE